MTKCDIEMVFGTEMVILIIESGLSHKRNNCSSFPIYLSFNKVVD